MLEENYSKRPTSGKYLQLRPITSKPKASQQNNYDINNNVKRNLLTLNQDKLETKEITESINKNEKEEINPQTTEKNKFLKLLGEEANKETFDYIISNEIERMKNINDKKKVLKNIKLIENNYDDLYEWTNLFNNSRPISSYTTLKKPKLNIKENKKIEEFKSPVVLVDLFEDQMNLYFGKNSQLFQNEDNKKKIKKKLLFNKSKKSSKDKKKLSIRITNSNKSTPKGDLLKSRKSSKQFTIHNNMHNNNINSSLNKESHNFIRPMSVYSPRLNSCSFYFSSAFSDYYKEDLKTFSEKMKILKAKVKSNPKKLNNEIRTQRCISSKKEKKLSRMLNVEQFNFGKDNLIIAGKRRNPIPLLKSIFKQTYPNKEVMKENIKMYFNTMKPLGEFDGPVDYTKNERWRLSEFIGELREGKNNIKTDRNCVNYNSFSNKNNIKIKNLILNYYNENDPYIKMFEKMVKNNRCKNNTENNKEQKCYNPILQNINNNFSKTNNKKFIEGNLEENIKNDELINNNGINRPKTSVNKVNKNTSTRRPLTSMFKKYNILYSNLNEEKRNSLQENYIDPNSNFEYTSSNCFPLKTLSNVGNASYDKINQMLQERQFGFAKLKYDYFITSTGQIKKISNNKKYNEEKIIFDKKQNSRNLAFSENNKWDDTFKKAKNNKKNKINYYNFSNIKNNFKNNLKNNNKADNLLYTLKYFKSLGGKFYSSSNSVNVKNKRKNKIKLLNNFYTESKYSRDEQDQDIDFIDEGVSSQTNSSYQKI